MTKPLHAALAALALALALVGTAAIPAAALAQTPTYTVQQNLAVGGYDPVAYFTQNQAVLGRAEFALTHNGATYRFASAAHRDQFRADPARYAPQYGGFCAWAASQGYQAPGRPQHWRIVNGKLYLNFNGDIQRRWERDIPGFIRAADANWPNEVKKRPGLFGL